MKKTIPLLCLLCLALAACGGGGGDTTPFSGPAVGTKTDYAVADTDNSANTVNWQLEATVLTVAADGGSTQSFIGSGGVVVNGTAYGNVNEVDTYDGNHALLSYTLAGPPPVNCVFDTPEAPLPLNTAPGAAWPVVNHQVACSSGVTVTYTRLSGSVIGVEPVTVPAGSFTATHAQYVRTTSSTTASGTRTESRDLWYDNVSGKLVKSVSDFTYTNPSTTTGYPVHETRQLLTHP